MSDADAPRLSITPGAITTTGDENPRSHTGSGYTVADLCRRWRVGEDKIRGFLQRGELVGVNLATSQSAKPQWRITPEAVREFEDRRTSRPTPKPQRRRRQRPGVDYFP